MEWIEWKVQKARSQVQVAREHWNTTIRGNDPQGDILDSLITALDELSQAVEKITAAVAAKA
jgi:hypothetical protein